MKFARNSRVESAVTSPSSVMRPGVNCKYASIAFISGELQKARVLRRCCWPTAVPILPGDAPGVRRLRATASFRLIDALAGLPAK